MAKRGRKPKSQVALQVNINTIREVSAVVFIVLGLVTILALFNAGGRVGAGLKIFAFDKFGIMGVFLPLAMIVLGFVMLSPDTLSARKKQVIGGVLGIIILTALLNTHGGIIGNKFMVLVQSGFGDVGAYLFLIALLLLDLIICFGISPRNIMGKVGLIGGKNRLPRNVHVIEPGGSERISVFTTVKRKIGLGRKPELAQNQMSLPAMQPNMPVWEPPPIDLLSVYNAKPTSGNIAKNVEVIRKKLGDFGIDVTMGDVNVGPTVTQYQIKPSEGVKINQISSRSDDLALALAAHPIRVEAPIPGKAAVGVEVPNKVTAKVSLREILETNSFKNRQSDLSLALGLDVAGAPIVIDLAKLPHLLIAGATGSGKSVCISAIITGLIYQNSPAELRFIMVDPKRVEFTAYNGIPYLLTPVVVDVDKTVNVLKWAVAEMERRFRIFQEVGARDLQSFNDMMSKGRNPSVAEGEMHDNGPIPNIVIVIDELSDLMAQAANEVEGAIVRLAQMARATGIHLVIATQRPSVNVITGLIKANVPARIAFAVASQVDSRTIIDQSGAEKLLGNGDMLYLGGETTKPKRIQGVMLNDKEIREVTDFLKRNGHAVYDQAILEFKPQGIMGGSGGESNDPMYQEAKEVVVHAGKASASLLQRRLKVGYARAARLLDILEENGVISPPDGAKPRDVYLDSIEAEPRSSAPPPASNNYGPQFGGGSAVTQYRHEPSNYGQYSGYKPQKDENTEPKEAELPPSVPRPSAPPPEPDIPRAREPESYQPLIRRYGVEAEKLSEYKPSEEELSAPNEPQPTRVYHPPERHLGDVAEGDSSEAKEASEAKENEKLEDEKVKNEKRSERYLRGGPGNFPLSKGEDKGVPEVKGVNEGEKKLDNEKSGNEKNKENE